MAMRADPGDGNQMISDRRRMSGFAAPSECQNESEFRAIATRYDKTARNFLAAVHLAAATIWLN
jgi:transposase